MEFHGWFNLWLYPDDTGDQLPVGEEERLQADQIDTLRTYLAEHFSGPNVTIDIATRNWSTTCTLTGCFNHAGQTHAQLTEFLNLIGNLLPGSYGLLYLQDDDSDHFRVIVMTRGQLREEADPFLSPINPVVEGPY